MKLSLPLLLSTSLWSFGVFASEALLNQVLANEDMPLETASNNVKLLPKPEEPVVEDDQQWSIFSHPSFPKYAIRVKDSNEICDSSVNQKVGYLDVAEGKHFFFCEFFLPRSSSGFFESRNQPKTDPLLLWLNGGPGCSSLTGLLMELGPCRVNPKGNGTTLNPYSWNTNANIIFLDQPVEVGFSYSDNGKFPTNSDSAAEDVYAFLQIFLSTFKQFAQNDFHVTGESYAGHYIPAIGRQIDESNELHAKDGSIVQVQLKSLAIGNGLTDPLIQYKEYPEMACDEKCRLPLTKSLISCRRTFPRRRAMSKNA